MKEYVNINDSSVSELKASQQEIVDETSGQKFDRFDFNADVEVVYRETPEGEDKHAMISDLFKIQNEGKRPLYLKLCARDKYGYKVHAWQPCRFGLFVNVDVP